MKKVFLALLALAFVSSPAYATGNPTGPMGGPQQPAGPGGTAGQQNPEIFSKIKQLRLDGMQGRISILQTALSCVNAATNHEQMKACEQQEHQAMEAHMQQQKAKMEALRPNGPGGPGGHQGPGGPPGGQAGPNAPGGQQR